MNVYSIQDIFNHKEGKVEEQVCVCIPADFFSPEYTQDVHKQKLPQLVALVDISGSMMTYASAIIHEALPSIAQRLGYPDDSSVELFLFNDRAERDSMTVRQLKSSYKWKARGGTYASDAIQKLDRYLNYNIKNDHIVIVVSDGDLHDPSGSQYASKNMYKSLNSHIERGALTVALFRIGAYADTEFMSTIGSCDNIQQQVPIVQFESIGHMEEFMASTISFRNLSIKTMDAKGHLSMIPGWDTKQSELKFPNHEGICFFVDADQKQLCINGIQVDLPDPVSLTSNNFHTAMHQHMRYLNSRYRYMLVSQINDRDAHIMRQWITRIVSTFEAYATTVFHEEFPSTRQRVDRATHKMTKRLISDLRMLANKAGRMYMNSQQKKANFLREAADTSAGRAAVRRYLKHGEVDWKVTFHEVIQKVCHDTHGSIEENKDSLCSYLTLESQASILKNIKESFDKHLFDTMDELDMASIVGHIGVCGDITARDYPSPWNVRWNTISLGVYACQSDIIYALQIREENPNIPPLKAPGTNSNINAVVPLRSPHKEAYDVIPFTVDQFMAAMFLRRSYVSIPEDVIALRASAALRIVEYILQQGDETECAMRHLRMIQTDIRETWYERLSQGNSLDADMRKDPVQAVLDNNISDMLQLWVLLFVSDYVTAEWLHVCCSVECYLKTKRYIKRTDNKMNVLHTYLKVPVRAPLVSVGPPGSPDPDVTETSFDVDGTPLLEEMMNLEQKGPDIATIISNGELGISNDLYKVLTATINYNIYRKEIDEIELPESHSEQLANMVAAHGFLTMNNKERRESNVPVSPELVKGYLHKRAIMMRHQVYIDALQKKREEEKKAHARNTVAQLLMSDDEDEILRLLPENRDTYVGQLLLRALSEWVDVPEDCDATQYVKAICDEKKTICDGKKMDQPPSFLSKVPFRLLHVVLLGRWPNHEEPVWCQGNVLRASWTKYLQPRTESERSILLEKRIQFVAHVYRGRCKFGEVRPPDDPYCLKNRHGHCNCHPSWYALGYNSYGEAISDGWKRR
jgi:hypothetical protein